LPCFLYQILGLLTLITLQYCIVMTCASYDELAFRTHFLTFWTFLSNVFEFCVVYIKYCQFFHYICTCVIYLEQSLKQNRQGPYQYKDPGLGSMEILIIKPSQSYNLNLVLGIPIPQRHGPYIGTAPCSLDLKLLWNVWNFAPTYWCKIWSLHAWQFVLDVAICTLVRIFMRYTRILFSLCSSEWKAIICLVFPSDILMIFNIAPLSPT